MTSVLRRSDERGGFVRGQLPIIVLDHTLIVLSAPPVIKRVPVMSNVEQNMPDSASSEPGCGMSSIFWNGVPVA